MPEFDLEQYLSRGIERILRDAVKATLRNPRESAFLAGFSLACTKAFRLRAESARKGGHVPPFLIASITSSCNLHCVGCYARANHSCSDSAEADTLSAAEWGDIFAQAAKLGVSFILLAGGEPLMRPDVLKKASETPSIVFPVFTNGTLIGTQVLRLFDECRNLVPMLSVEGNGPETDARRGAGVSEKLNGVMEQLHSRGVFYGVSVTVTSRNLAAVTNAGFLNDLARKGCKAAIYVEYVPADSTAGSLALSETERAELAAGIGRLRAEGTEMVLISFPGDEKASGGCLAAGRGFFHINSHGGAEPCPFSPFSDTSLKDTPLDKALNSPLFQKLSESQLLQGEHTGGCVLFGKEKAVGKLLETQHAS